MFFGVLPELQRGADGQFRSPGDHDPVARPVEKAPPLPPFDDPEPDQQMSERVERHRTRLLGGKDILERLEAEHHAGQVLADLRFGDRQLYPRFPRQARDLGHELIRRPPLKAVKEDIRRDEPEQLDAPPVGLLPRLIDDLLQFVQLMPDRMPDHPPGGPLGLALERLARPLPVPPPVDEPTHPVRRQVRRHAPHPLRHAHHRPPSAPG